MKTKLFIVSALLCSAYAFSQNLVLGKMNYDGDTESHSLLTLNSNTGEVLNTTNYVTDSWPMSFNSQTNEIVGFDVNLGDGNSGKIVFKNINTNNETYITLPEDYEYYDRLITADNRLFVTTENTILEINPSNGNIIGTHTLNLNIAPPYYAYINRLAYSHTTKDIYGTVYGLSFVDWGSTVFKFNIITNEETIFVLPESNGNESSNHTGVVIAENSLFVSKRLSNSNNSTTVNSLLEIDTQNGSIINTYNYTTNYMEGYNLPVIDLTYLADTQEICALAKVDISTGIVTESRAKIIKYNINTNVESAFELPTLYNNHLYLNYDGFYGERIISTVTEENLSLPEFQQENDTKVIKAYNLLGQEVPVETYNQIIILKYDNGETKKVYIKK